MPELPEVETVVRALKSELVGERISAIKVHVDKLRSTLDLAEQPEIINRNITSITRRAKYILIGFENGWCLINHLGMTGKWRLETTVEPRQKHDHAEFFLFSGLVLRYNDTRRFGQLVVLAPDIRIANHPLFSQLGPEPLTDDFNLDWLEQICRKRKKPIKSLIMDNAVVVGVGNIYASESLFRAGIVPQVAANTISKPRLKKLLDSIKSVLGDAVEAGGSTIKDYAGVNGAEGLFAQELKVYGRAGAKCLQCKKGIVRKIVQCGRSSFYCPVCQC